MFTQSPENKTKVELSSSQSSNYWGFLKLLLYYNKNYSTCLVLVQTKEDLFKHNCSNITEKLLTGKYRIKSNKKQNYSKLTNFKQFLLLFNKKRWDYEVFYSQNACQNS